MTKPVATVVNLVNIQRRSNLEKNKIVGKARGPVGSSNVDSSNFGSPALKHNTSRFKYSGLDKTYQQEQYKMGIFKEKANWKKNLL